MSEVTVVNATNNQAQFDYDVSKIFVWNNRYETGSLLNASGGVKTFLPGTLMGRIAASQKLVPCASGATDGSQFPVGILKTNVADMADAASQDVNICISGDVVEAKVIFDGTDTINTIVDLKILGDRIAGDTMGIKLVDGIELTNFDNQ